MDPRLRDRLARETTFQRELEREEFQRRIEHGERPWEASRGLDSAVDAVRDLRFPKAADEIAEAAGDREVVLRADARLPLRALLEVLDESYFVTIMEFHDAVERRWAEALAAAGAAPGGPPAA